MQNTLAAWAGTLQPSVVPLYATPAQPPAAQAVAPAVIKALLHARRHGQQPCDDPRDLAALERASNALLGSVNEAFRSLGMKPSVSEADALAAAPAERQLLTEEQIADAKRWNYVRAHWSNAQFHWNRDQSLKSVVLTIKAAHQGAAAKELEREIDAAIEAARCIGAQPQAAAEMCHNCDTALPDGCGGLFKDETACRLRSPAAGEA